MKGKIEKKLIWIQFFILTAFVGAGVLIYNVSAPFYHRYQGNRLLWEAYDALEGMDLEMLEDSDESALLQYEEQNLRFTISDEDFTPIYTTWGEGTDHQVEQHIKKHLSEFSRTPTLNNRQYGKLSVVKITGIMEQDGEFYYVSLRRKILSNNFLQRNTRFIFLVFFSVIFLFLPILYLFYRHTAKSLEEILEGADRIRRKDFEVELEEEGTCSEWNALARNMNWMAAQLQEFEEKKAQEGEEQRKMQQAWEILENIRKDVVADISHELKTPLAIISSQVEMLQCMDERIDRSYYYDSIVEEVSRMSDMVGELMDLSFQEQDLQDMERCEINLSDIMEYVRLKYQALFGQNHIKGEFSVEPDCYVWGNGHYLEQAIDNYIMNAFSHTAQGNEIRVCLYREEDWVWVTVYNQGRPIQEQDQVQIWQDYVIQRHDQPVEEESLEQRHMGVGLYLVSRIIRLHQGEYGVENVDKGVEFWFRIPAKKK